MTKVTIKFQVSVSETDDIIKLEKVIKTYQEWLNFKQEITKKFPVTIEETILKIFKEKKIKLNDYKVGVDIGDNNPVVP